VFHIATLNYPVPTIVLAAARGIIKKATLILAFYFPTRFSGKGHFDAAGVGT
jgi:hypothetical protein